MATTLYGIKNCEKLIMEEPQKKPEVTTGLLIYLKLGKSIRKRHSGVTQL
ncbi:hypothetical protein ACK31V_08135 [Aeromonas caviae]